MTLGAILEAQNLNNFDLHRHALTSPQNRRLLAHWGVHVAFWPSAVPAWSDDDPEKLVRLAECGIDAIKRALDGTQEQVCRGLVHIIWIATGMIQDCKLMAED